MTANTKYEYVKTINSLLSILYSHFPIFILYSNRRLKTQVVEMKFLWIVVGYTKQDDVIQNEKIRADWGINKVNDEVDK